MRKRLRFCCCLHECVQRGRQSAAEQPPLHPFDPCPGQCFVFSLNCLNNIEPRTNPSIAPPRTSARCVCKRRALAFMCAAAAAAAATARSYAALQRTGNCRRNSPRFLSCIIVFGICVYTNDSLFLLEMRGIMEEWFDFADKVGGGVDEAAAVAAALQTLRSRRIAAVRTREASPSGGRVDYACP